MTSTPRPPSPPDLKQVLARKMVFVSGKGGVGKSLVTQALALGLSARGRRTLWVEIEDPIKPPGELTQLSRNLWHLNCEATRAFTEYAYLKVGNSALTRLFVENKLMKYLAKASPGIHELVLLGKIWHERVRYDSIVVDMPSTGHGLAMFQSTKNYSVLFSGGPVHVDAVAMINTFADPGEAGHVVVALPEEMPLQEALELDVFLQDLFPKNRAAFLVNRLLPRTGTEPATVETRSPVAADADEYIQRRLRLEEHNLRLWKEKAIPYRELTYVPPPPQKETQLIAEALQQQLFDSGVL